MIFSELSLITDATGLQFDEENAILYGNKNGVPVMVFDNENRRRIDIVCGAVLSDECIPEIRRMTFSFPKKTLIGIENENGCVKIYCNGFYLMQENLPLLITFLDKLTSYAKANASSYTTLTSSDVLRLGAYEVKKMVADDKPKKNRKKGKPFDIKSTLKGVLGGLIGTLVGSSIFVLFILASDILGWMGGVVMAAAVISLYSAFSHKMKAPDVIISSAMVLFGWLFSNVFAYLFRIFLKAREDNPGVNIFGILENINYFMTKYYEQTNLFSNNLMVSVVFVVAGAIGSYWFYYRHNRKDMY